MSLKNFCGCRTPLSALLRNFVELSASFEPLSLNNSTKTGLNHLKISLKLNRVEFHGILSNTNHSIISGLLRRLKVFLLVAFKKEDSSLKFDEYLSRSLIRRCTQDKVKWLIVAECI